MQALAFGKINLYLNVLGKREDGFHEVCMVMQAIRLADHIRILEAPSNKISTNNRYVPDNHKNLAMRAAMAMQDAYDLPPVSIEIQKNIPISAGLAGGSADAAQVIMLMNKIFQLEAPIEELSALGAKLGSDIPFCMQGPTAVALGRGEELLPLQTLPKRPIVLVKPDFPVSTAKVYGHYASLRNEERKPPRVDFAHVLSALSQGDWKRVEKGMFNALEPATFSLYPKVEAIKKDIQSSTSGPVLMSGSGPTILCVLEDAKEAWVLYKELSRRYKNCYLTSTVDEGDLARQYSEF